MPTKNLPKKIKLLQKIGCKVAESTYIPCDQQLINVEQLSLLIKF
jgi:hypothetical protein